MGKGLGLCCAIGAVTLLVSAPAMAKAEENRVPERRAYCNLYVKQMIREKSYSHALDAEGRLCNNSFRRRSHTGDCEDIRIPERRYSDGSIQRYTRRTYLDSYCCNSCGYVFSEEELEYLLSLEIQEAVRESEKEE